MRCQVLAPAGCVFACGCCKESVTIAAMEASDASNASLHSQRGACRQGLTRHRSALIALTSGRLRAPPEGCACLVPLSKQGVCCSTVACRSCFPGQAA